MTSCCIGKPVRISPAYDDRERIAALFARNSPYPAVAKYLPDGSDETEQPKALDAVLPWFRSTWALGGVPLAAGAAEILHNPRFIAAAQQLFPAARIVPTFVVVNVNAPMPAGVPHVDVPNFHGATRESLPLKLLIAMGASGLFERWRVVQAGAVSWFYEGVGGGFDYWPDGPQGPMHSEKAPFTNVAIVADNDRMYHRIGAIGEVGTPLPRMTAGARIRFADNQWVVEDEDECRARYALTAVRCSIVWKADVLRSEPAATPEALTPRQIVDTLERDLSERGERETTAPDPTADPIWIERVYRFYSRLAQAHVPQPAP